MAYLQVIVCIICRELLGGILRYQIEFKNRNVDYYGIFVVLVEKG